jgi:hypothetical protein
MLAHLRIAGVVTFAVARLATDLAGYSLVVRALHPTDDLPNFVATAWFYSFRTSIAWSQQPLRPSGEESGEGLEASGEVA